ncbi:hypothetical protein A3K87_16150 [Variovorax paradoxus]|uniref:Uncharacterized protein n=1 Tax=Variovorax paradoxus TaxID=34073 RepID=A0AA91DNK3_VARPD|nr:hypothetical protein A3K87_16150 [Variovorax paradoxus]
MAIGVDAGGVEGGVCAAVVSAKAASAQALAQFLKDREFMVFPSWVEFQVAASRPAIAQVRQSVAQN